MRPPENTTLFWVTLWLLLAGFCPETQAEKNKFKVTYPDGRSEEYKYDDKSCDLIGWQKKVGINVSLKKLKDYQANFGLSVERIRQLDDIEKDFGLQYEVLCRERQSGVFPRERMKLYDCRSKNVGDALSALRALKLTLDAVKEARQAETVKTDVVTLVDKVLTAIPNGFSGSCLSKHLHLGRDRLEMTTAEKEESIPVINGGAYRIRWWPKTDMPQIYPEPPFGGYLDPGTGYPLTVRPSPMNGGGSAEGVLVVEDDLGETAQCTIKLTGAQQERIKNAIGAVEGKKGQEAVQAAQKAAAWMAPGASPATQDLFVGELLTLSDNGQEAWGVLSKLRDQHPEVSQQPEFQIAWGASAYKIGDRDTALMAFRSAGAHHEYAPLASGYQAYALTAEGKHDQARPYISAFESQPEVSQDSWISRTLQRLFNVFIDDEKKP